MLDESQQFECLEMVIYVRQLLNAGSLRRQKSLSWEIDFIL